MKETINVPSGLTSNRNHRLYRLLCHLSTFFKYVSPDDRFAIHIGDIAFNGDFFLLFSVINTVFCQNIIFVLRNIINFCTVETPIKHFCYDLIVGILGISCSEYAWSTIKISRKSVVFILNNYLIEY